MTETPRYQHLRAPAGNGEVLCVPTWTELKSNLAAHQEPTLDSHLQLFGKPLAHIREVARQVILDSATGYTRSYADLPERPGTTGPLILTGHQPELFHPGVWLKNFAAAELAHQLGGTAVNLIIDSDLCRTATIRVPTGTIENPRVANVPFDQSLPQLPFEEREIDDRDLLHSFGQRVTETLAPFVANPLISEWWPEVVRRSQSIRLLGMATAQSRHLLELAWHHPSLELAQSEVCRTEPFHLFALHLLTHAAEFRQAHNTALAAYRQLHHIRNHAQPVPNLHKQGEWVEVPFWLWTTDEPIRRALFVRNVQHGIEVTDRAKFQKILPITADGDSDAAVQLLAEWGQQGIKLRTRALVTTMFARLFVADLFIHGIGGAKYDEVTDGICQEFFGSCPPGYATISGTLRLPIGLPPEDPQRARQLKQELRELTYHPERFLGNLTIPPKEQARIDSLVEEKRNWILEPKTHANASARHARINSVNRELLSYFTENRELREQELTLVTERVRNNKVLESRDYPFCLFPPDTLRKFLLDFSTSVA